MIEDAMKAVSSAEAAATDMIQEAKSKAEKIKKQSDADYDKLLKDAEIAAKQKENDELKKNEDSRLSALKDMEKVAAEKADALRKKASAKEDTAIEKVIETLLG